MDNLSKTKRGLPNSCSECGQPVSDEWYAVNQDAARAGQGVCAVCAGVAEPEQDDDPAGDPAGDPADEKPVSKKRRGSK